ncbi:GNAT family N-acetyltransferase [Calothrix sp. NIES-3974]|uniref:GNAT family N-acetyltransferase n=1 Tax=Calothrix sp. NIES-3974 TaxID=2005462 RepID=UPI000B60AACC|nr:GNAT family N-acetyltransferase [Calothrix sp. NIES-3974]BAZ08118.1 acetyltransferase, GNAT family protein [Calothrix sp. NIES-3974]
MNQHLTLPPHISIRRATVKDKWEIQTLLLTWDDNRQVANYNLYILMTWSVILVIVFIYSWLLAVCIFGIYLLSEYAFKSYNTFWVIEANQVILGCAELRNMRQHSLLFNVCIKRKYRHQKLGSYLIKHIIQYAKKPLYLGCYQELIPFYSRFGFTVISPNLLSLEIQFSLGLNQGNPIIPMVLWE